MFKSIVAAAIAVLLSAEWAEAAEVTGLWHTPTGGEVAVYPCGHALCGRLENSTRLRANPGLKDGLNKDPALRGRPLKGMVLIQGARGGPPTWADGQLYNPEDGNTYGGSLTLMGDGTLQLKGCALVVLCKTQVWTRIR